MIGVAGPGKAWLGSARQGGARQGKATWLSQILAKSRPALTFEFNANSKSKPNLS